MSLLTTGQNLAHLYIRKLAKNLGIIEALTSFKRKFIYHENAFKPADPRLLISVEHCLQKLKNENLLEGSDYFEFGIYRGFNLWFTQRLVNSWKISDMRFFGFDSFFGLPPIKGVDQGGPFNEGDFYASHFEVKSFLDRFGVNWKQTFLINGWFKDTLNKKTANEHKLRRISLCVIDCDLYESTVDVLRFIKPYIHDKTIIWFDDWSDFGADNKEQGEQKAFTEFMADNPQLSAEPYIIEEGSGQGFILRYN